MFKRASRIAGFYGCTWRANCSQRSKGKNEPGRCNGSGGAGAIGIAGSVRRGKQEVGDLEIVCIPRRIWEMDGGPSELFPGEPRLARDPGVVPVREETDLYRLLGLEWRVPENRR